MENQLLILKFKNQEQKFSYENKATLVEDKKLVQNLSKPNIKNQDSELLIKSLNDTHISDVIQIRVNIAETGFVLASFAKDSLTDEARTSLIQEIEKLRNNDNPTKELSIQKIQELLGILNNFAPIYAAFSNNGDIKIEFTEISKFDLKFPLLVLAQPERKMIFKIERKETNEKKQKPPKKTKEKEVKPKVEKQPKVRKEYPSFPLFDSDYFFILFFAFLGAFSVTASVFELMNKEGIAAFLIVLSVILFITLVISITSVIYKKGELRNPWLRYYLIPYILVGIIGGVISSFFICKGLLKTEIKDFNYKRMTLFSSLISASLLVSLSLSRLVNLINKLRLKKKSQ